MTLRTRLIAAMSVIALTLVAAMVFVTRSTEANLTAQVDDDLAGASRAAEAIAYGLGDPPPPEDSPLGVDEAQADSRVEPPGQDRVPDGQAPQHAGVCGLGVGVGQGADPAGRFRHGGLVV